jgi:putative heme transporter
MVDAQIVTARRPWVQAIVRWTLTLLVFWFVFVFLLPRFIDYRDVIETMATLTAWQVAALLAFTAVRSLAQSAVYTGVIPGLRFWPGWQAYEASGTLASFAPPGVDMAVRYGMYRSFGVPASDAGAGFLLSGIFTIGIKFALPVLALILVLISGEYTRGTTIVTIIAVSGLAMVLAVIILRREDLARRLGQRVGGWYNRLLAGRWKFETIDRPGERLVEFRGQIASTLGKVWPRATAAQLGAETASFIVLLMALRFLGVSSSEASFGVVFVAYAVGLIASLIPFLPQGLGAVELVYVFIIAGTEKGDLADTVMAAAFTHRIFTWFIPILVGFVPLAMWRRRIRVEGQKTPHPEVR